MGQFSWICSKCGEPIYNMGNNNEHGRDVGDAAVLMTPDGPHFEDAYQGYGVFGGIDAYTWLASEYGKIPALIDHNHPERSP